jgi:hypothetical protein
MQHKGIVAASLIALLLILSGLGCALTALGMLRQQSVSQSLPTVTRTRIPRESIDFEATSIAATVDALGGYMLTMTPLRVWPTATSTPFDQASFLATINAQFAYATETAIALATPTFTPSPTLPPTPTPPPPLILPPSGGDLTHP